MIESHTINLSELADQCFRVWEEINKHKIKYKLNEILNKQQSSNEKLGNEIEKLSNILKPTWRVDYE